MNLLIVLKKDSHIRAIVEHVARRFDRKEIKVRLLALLEEGDLIPNRQGSRTSRLLAEVSDLLRAAWSIENVETCIGQGNPAENIDRESRRFAADVVLMEMTNRRNLLEVFRQQQIIFRLFENGCRSVELIGKFAVDSANPLEVMVPIAGENLSEFSVERFQALAWPKGARITLLGLVNPTIDRSRLEVNAGALLMAERHLARRISEMEQHFQVHCNYLYQLLDGKVDIDYQVTAGNAREALKSGFSSNRRELLVSGFTGKRTILNRVVAALMPVTLAAPASHSMLLLSPIPGCFQSSPAI